MIFFSVINYVLRCSLVTIHKKYWYSKSQKYHTNRLFLPAIVSLTYYMLAVGFGIQQRTRKNGSFLIT